MPVHVNSIDSFTFADLVGTTYFSQQEIELIPRPGVDGLGARRSGVRGKPFVMVSICYHADFTTAAASLAEYTDLVGHNPVSLTRNSVDMGNFLVLEVTEHKPPQAVINVAGYPGAQCRAEVKWSLVQP